MNATTLGALAAFPQQLEDHYAAIPAGFEHWTPPSWDGVPSERLTAIEQVCHVRDIEIEGYHRRFERTLQESHPTLPGIDSEAIAVARSYASSNASEALAAFRAARATTLQLISGLRPEQWLRTAMFDDYGPTTLRGLVHFLCSHDQQHLAGLQWLLGKIEAVRMQPRC
ncbi:MAG: DinB family protein [Luteimonas sp.]